MLNKLSKREKQALELLVTGADDTLIAEKLGITKSTLSTHITNMYNKMVEGGYKPRVRVTYLYFMEKLKELRGEVDDRK